MKQAIIFLLTGATAMLLSGCSSTKSASTDTGKLRTSYTMPLAQDSGTSTAEPGWSLSPSVQP